MSTINSLKLALSIALLFSMLPLAYATTFTVTTTADNGNNGAPTSGSLRAAIVENNLNAGPNIINFAIATGTAPYTIQPPVDLPSILEPVTINGYSQSGSSANTATFGNNAVILVVLDGTDAPTDGSTTGNGLHFINGSSASTVQGLAISNWKLNGILIDATTNPGAISGIQIFGNFIGTDLTGTIAAPNRTGIGIAGSVSPLYPVTGTLIGNASVANRNLINGSSGHTTADSYGIVGACICSAYNTGTIITNNFMGTNFNGTQALGSSVCGITFIGETSSTIG